MKAVQNSKRANSLKLLNAHPTRRKVLSQRTTGFAAGAVNRAMARKSHPFGRSGR